MLLSDDPRTHIRAVAADGGLGQAPVVHNRLSEMLGRDSVIATRSRKSPVQAPA